MFPTLTIGGAVLPTGPLALILGAWVALSVVERAARMLKQDANLAYGVASTGLLAGAVGARLLFVALHWSAYQDHLLGIIWPINSGYNAWGGLIAGMAAAFFYGRARGADGASLLDALAPGLITGFLFLSLSDFLAGPGYGEATSLFWGISQFGIRRHPVQLYEVAAALFALLIWWRALPRRALPRRRLPGQLFLVATASYAAGRLLIDPFRANAWLSRGGFHLVQGIALAALLLSLGWLAYLAAPPPGRE